MDTLSDLMFARRALRTVGRPMPGVPKSVALGRQHFGKLEAHSGQLPTEVTKKRIQGKQAARPYAPEFRRKRTVGKKHPAKAYQLMAA